MGLSGLAGIKGEKVSDPPPATPFSHPWKEREWLDHPMGSGQAWLILTLILILALLLLRFRGTAAVWDPQADR